MDYGLTELAKLLKSQTDDQTVKIGHLRILRNESALVGRKIEELEHSLCEQEKYIVMLEKQFHTLEDKVISSGLKSIKKEVGSGRKRKGLDWFGSSSSQS